MPHTPPRNPMKAHRKLIERRGNVVRVDFGNPGHALTKRQLAAFFGKTERWVEKKVAAGMPELPKDRRGRCRFDLGECRMWLTQQEETADAIRS